MVIHIRHLDGGKNSWLNISVNRNLPWLKPGEVSLFRDALKPQPSFLMTHGRRLLFAAVWTCACIIFSSPPLAHAVAPNASDTHDIIVSEIAWAGSSKSEADEWIELTNVSSQSISLEGWTLSGALVSGGIYTFPSIVLASQQAFLLANYPAGDAKSVLVRAPDAVTSAVSLSNSALQLALKRPDGSIADQAGNGKTPLAGHASPSFIAMVRLSPVTDGTVKESWADAIDVGTPGIIEPWFVPTPTLPVTVPTIPVIPPVPEPIPPPVVESPPVIQVLVPVPTTVPDPAPEQTAPAVTNPPLSIVNETLLAEEIVRTEEVPTQSADLAPDALAENVDAVEQTSMTIPTAYPPGTLAISEFVPAPNKGEEEWVEIANPFNNVIRLNEWKVKNARGTSVALPEQLLGFEQRVVVRLKSGFLTNASGKVLLVDPTGAITDWIAYGTGDIATPKTGEALALGTSGAWLITTTPTPGDANIIVPRAVKTVTAPPTVYVSGIVSEAVTIVSETDMPTPLVDAVPVPFIGHFILSELYPNTGHDTQDEFIEIKNAGTEAADFSGWTLRDKSGAAFVQKTTLPVPAGEAVTLTRPTTRLSLNNTGDEITLLQPDKTAADHRAYEKAPKGKSYGLVGDIWTWQAPTPDEENMLDAVPPPKQETPKPVAVKKPAKKPAVTKPTVVNTTLDGIVVARSGRNITVEKDGATFTVQAPVGSDYGALGIHSGRRIEAIGTLTEKNGKRILSVVNTVNIHTDEAIKPDVVSVPTGKDTRQTNEERAGIGLALASAASAAGFALRKLFLRT